MQKRSEDPVELRRSYLAATKQMKKSEKERVLERIGSWRNKEEGERRLLKQLVACLLNVSLPRRSIDKAIDTYD